MIIVANIGNTHFNFAINKEKEIFGFRHEIINIETSKDFIKILEQMLIDLNITKNDVTEAALSSVVPKFTEQFIVAIKELFGIDTFIVNSDVNMELDLSLYNKKQIGNDRIIICEAAISKYELPLIVFDFGTATTINVVDESKLFLGGSILPGLTMGLEALSTNTAQLPKIQISQDDLEIIGKNTQECLLSGAIYGNISMIEGMVNRIGASLNKNPTVIITGGGTKYISSLLSPKFICDQNLIFEGLCILLKKNNDK